MENSKSIFATNKKTKYPSLKENIKTEVLIIGGGIAGILCAHYLREAGKKVVLIEKNKIASGITQNSTACISILNDTSYQELVKYFGLNKIKKYVDISKQAVDAYKGLAKQHIFDFEEKPALIYSFDEKWLEKEQATFRALNIDFTFEKEIALPFKTKGAIKVKEQGEMNVVKLIGALAKNLTIYENTMVKNIKENHAICQNDVVISFDKAIVATHFPVFNRRGKYFMKMYQERSYVVALKNAPNVQGTYISSKAGELYLRNYADYLLVGGKDKRTGKTEQRMTNLIQVAKAYFPSGEVSFVWGNQDCISLDGLPYIGQYSPRWPHVFVTSGFNMSGMTHAMIGALLLRDKIVGNSNIYYDLFNPKRHMKMLPLLQNLGHTLINFIKPSTKRCSHLGCSLQWNASENTFDCPCHGSRFSQEGKLLENPAQKNKKKPLKKKEQLKDKSN